MVTLDRTSQEAIIPIQQGSTGASMTLFFKGILSSLLERSECLLMVEGILAVSN